MDDLIGPFKEGNAWLWGGVCTAVYMQAGWIGLQLLDVWSSGAGWPDWVINAGVTGAVLGLPLSTLGGVLIARALRRKWLLQEDSPKLLADAKLKQLEEERDFYRDLVEGRKRT